MPILHKTVLNLTHLAPFFFCTVSATLLLASTLGVTTPLAVRRLPSFRAPFFSPLSLSDSLGVTTT